MAAEKLIPVVTDNPVIYDPSLKSYDDQCKKSKAWRNVATSVR